MLPHILIAHTDHFMNAARLTLAFRAVGCRVQVLSRRSHPLRRWPLAFVERLFNYNPLAPLRSFRSAIVGAAPDLIIACDDGSVRLLHRLHLNEMKRQGSPTLVAQTIGRSLGRPDAYSLLFVRSRLAGFEAAATNGPTGRATVMRIVDNHQMRRVAERIVGTFGLSGFCGLDFVLEQGTGLAYLIEINPRATQMNHLALGAKQDLVAALRARLSGAPLVDRPAVTDRDLVVVFPAQGGAQDLLSPAAAYYDTPFEAPDSPMDRGPDDAARLSSAAGNGARRR